MLSLSSDFGSEIFDYVNFYFRLSFLSCLSCVQLTVMIFNILIGSPAVEIYIYLIYFTFISSTGTG